MESKDKSSRSGSRSNLNESAIPLLMDEDLEKEKIELKEKASIKDGAGSSEEELNEKDDSKTEKQDGCSADASTIQPEGETSGNNGGAAALDKDGKKKKTKKENGHQRKPSCVNTLSVGLNILDRDDKHINDFVNIQFDDVICEPDSSHSFDAIWRLTFIVFSATKLWSYRLMAALVALPCAIFCGFNFALLTCINVWAITPAMRILTIKFGFVKRIWSMVFRTIFDPIFSSVGMLFSNIYIQRTHTQV